MTRLIRVHDDLYAELRRIQKKMWDSTGVEISLSEASRIYLSKKAKPRGPQAEFKFHV